MLGNDNIKLDWFFRASFAQDIAMVTIQMYSINYKRKHYKYAAISVVVCSKKDCTS